MATFFEVLERMNPGSDRSGLPAWFSTHPIPQDRVVVVRAQASDLQRRLGLQRPKIEREAYLKRIDGIAYGEDPRQGYVAEGMFFHPDLRFQFPVPADWEVSNTPTQVQLVSKAEDAIIVLMVARGSSSKEAARAFVTQTRASVKRAEAREVNGFISERLVSDIRTDKGVLRVMSYFIQKDKSIYMFHGVTSPALFQKKEGVFDSIMGQFRELTDPAKINVRPHHLRVRTVASTDTLENALRFLGVPEKQLKETVLLNGGVPTQRITANGLLKVIED
jgi:predicted Zn-dependent protease